MPIFHHRRWFGRQQSDHGAWIEPGRLLLAAFPSVAELQVYRDQGVRVVINLHHRSHDAALLAALGLTEVHLPVRDFTPPTPGQIDQGVAAISRTIEGGQAAMVHCLGGRGRSGTLAACYLVSQGLPVAAAIARVRELRPGAIETHRQETAIEAWSRLPGRAAAPSTAADHREAER